MACPICGGKEGGTTGSYPNLVCDECDKRAVNEDGEEPWHGWPPGEKPDPDDGAILNVPDRGENPVFIDGQKCWRRYRFGGWVTMADEDDCDSITEFYEEHGLL